MPSLCLHCPYCLEEIKVPAAYAGQPVRCSGCRKIVLLPLDSEVVEADDALPDKVLVTSPPAS